MREHDSVCGVESKEDSWYQLLASIFTHTQRENRREDRERKIGREIKTMRDRDRETGQDRQTREHEKERKTNPWQTLRWDSFQAGLGRNRLISSNV